MSDNEHNNEISEDRIVQSIYDHLVTSVCIGVASSMHELIKTGGMPLTELKEPSSRLEVFPELYKDKTPAEVQEALDEYATEIPKRSRKRKLARHTEQQATASSDNEDEDFKVASEPAAPVTQTRQTINHLDIWGRMPPKEPKQTCECKICGRHVSTTRFASHLDKCMGLSTRAPGNMGGTPRTSMGS